MKSIVKIAMACGMAAFLGIGCAVGASFIKWNNVKTEVESKNLPERDKEWETRPMNIDDSADGCLYPTFIIFTENVIEEYEYDDVYCIRYCDNDFELLGDCEIFVDKLSYRMIHECVRTGYHTDGLLVPVDETEDNFHIYTFKPSAI